MNRRNFLKKSFLSSIILLLSPTAFKKKAPELIEEGATIRSGWEIHTHDDHLNLVAPHKTSRTGAFFGDFKDMPNKLIIK